MSLQGLHPPDQTQESATPEKIALLLMGKLTGLEYAE